MTQCWLNADPIAIPKFWPLVRTSSLPKLSFVTAADLKGIFLNCKKQQQQLQSPLQLYAHALGPKGFCSKSKSQMSKWTNGHASTLRKKRAAKIISHTMQNPCSNFFNPRQITQFKIKELLNLVTLRHTGGNDLWVIIDHRGPVNIDLTCGRLSSADRRRRLTGNQSWTPAPKTEQFFTICDKWDLWHSAQEAESKLTTGIQGFWKSDFSMFIKGNRQTPGAEVCPARVYWHFFHSICMSLKCKRNTAKYYYRFWCLLGFSFWVSPTKPSFGAKRNTSLIIYFPL